MSEHTTFSYPSGFLMYDMAGYGRSSWQVVVNFVGYTYNYCMKMILASNNVLLAQIAKI